MKYIDEFRDKKLIRVLAAKVRYIAPQEDINIMEVCGTHTQNFFRFGLDKLLPKQIHFISGPGCPVCVSSQEYIDKAIAYAKKKDVIMLTFGDMLRVPGSRGSLEKARADGADVRMLYSPLDALEIAKNNPNEKVIFLAVGFETTSPTIALTITRAKKEKIKNLFFFSALKSITPAMRHLVKDPRLKIAGFLCPGHVSAIIGMRPYVFISRDYRIACCVSGFEPLDILEGIYLLLEQIARHKPKVDNQYTRIVTEAGNLRAQKAIRTVFKVADASWRGLGEIPQSGLRLKDEFAEFDITRVMPINIKHYTLNIKQKKCLCADVLKGLAIPSECLLFRKACTPDNPVGPCMISSEGACNAYFKYH